MLVGRTRTYLAISIAGATALMILAAGVVFSGAWQIFSASPGTSEECGCNLTPILGTREWLTLGLAGLFAAGVLFGVLYALGTMVRTRRMLRRLTIERSAGDVVYFRGGRCEAFTFGLLHPKIALCAHCLESLPSAELEAMRVHEAHHVARRDPLKLFLVNALARVFFFMPLLRTLSKAYRTVVELEADEKVENREALGGALLRLADASQDVVATAQFTSVINTRIERLVNPAWRMQVHFRMGSVVLAFMLAFGVLGSTRERPVQAGVPVLCAPRTAQCMMDKHIDPLGTMYYNSGL